MRIALHLIYKDYLYDYLDIGIKTFIVDGPMSAFSYITYSLEDIKDIRNIVEELWVNVNGLYEEHELNDLFRYIDKLHDISIDGVLFQDFSVLRYIKKKHYDIKLMYAPMTLNTNSYTINTLSKQGITHAFISKEIPLSEQLLIKKNTSIPLMIQAHGVQYIASSRRYLLHNYQNYTHKDISKNIIMTPKESDYPIHVYEDNRGTTIYSVNKLYTLDLLNTIQFDYLYIETLYMSTTESIEVSSIYQDCLNALNNNTYNHYVKEYLPLLRQISSPLDRGFLYDHTIYTLDDIKRRDNHE